MASVILRFKNFCFFFFLFNFNLGLSLFEAHYQYVAHVCVVVLLCCCVVLFIVVSAVHVVEFVVPVVCML